MAEISASQVIKLRKISGQGMMDCKKALEQAGGDVEAAMDILRKKGLATLSKRSGRETSEGIVVGRTSPDGRIAVLATLCCETDFVARSEDFVAAAETLGYYAMACEENQGAENVLKTSIDNKKFNEYLTEVVSKTGEKIQVGDFAKYQLAGPGLITMYIHFNKKVGTMVEIQTSDENMASCDRMQQAASDLAMHITATNPLALDKSGISPETIEREKAICAEQFKDKPANVADKIAEGRMKKFYSENCLLEQPFVKDDSKTVADVLAEVGKQGAGWAKITKFARFGVG